MKKAIILAIILLFTPSLVFAFCPPYSVELDNQPNFPACLEVQLDKTCGGRIKIINNCNYNFYLYNEDGTLNKNEVIINQDELRLNSSEYKELKEETGVSYVGVKYLPDVGFYGMYDGDCYHSEDKKMFNGYDLCKDEYGKLKNNTVINNWKVSLYSENDKNDIIFEGRTLYKKYPFDLMSIFYYLYLLSIILLVISIIFFIRRFFFKKINSLRYALIFLFISIFLFLFYFLMNI